MLTAVAANRAAAWLKSEGFGEAIADADEAINLDRTYTKVGELVAELNVSYTLTGVLSQGKCSHGNHAPALSRKRS